VPSAHKRMADIVAEAEIEASYDEEVNEGEDSERNGANDRKEEQADANGTETEPEAIPAKNLHVRNLSYQVIAKRILVIILTISDNRGYSSRGFLGPWRAALRQCHQRACH
jgi:hypothetical protein